MPLPRASFFFFDDDSRVKRRRRFSLPSCRYLSRCRVRKEVKKKVTYYFLPLLFQQLMGITLNGPNGPTAVQLVEMVRKRG